MSDEPVHEARACIKGQHLVTGILDGASVILQCEVCHWTHTVSIEEARDLGVDCGAPL